MYRHGQQNHINSSKNVEHAKQNRNRKPPKKESFVIGIEINIIEKKRRKAYTSYNELTLVHL